MISCYQKKNRLKSTNIKQDTTGETAISDKYLIVVSTFNVKTECGFF